MSKFKEWAVVELFGHQKIAGCVSEQELAGTGFVRVDVPAVCGKQEFTKLFGPSAIYSIAPVSEEVAHRAAERLVAHPVSVWIPQLEDRSGDDDSAVCEREEYFEAEFSAEGETQRDIG